MWCWHRIRESESGLCPACRTPYGDDPHEFSAVDVEEVLKANKEKEAAAKRERHRQHSDGNSSDGEGIGSSGGKQGQMEVPRDRTQLANMRVIRRNLVYAVGLPPNVASEDTLRKPEYFGQYGKISKIVLNRSQTTGGDLRRASASAYVTFLYKEDTLSCILAMDGFYLDGRNIRASYGTSKYCSAFIKNVRCNNPECTYLHQMGDVEDTFTKQEIQAGYVTSGRDVLARQQQIVQQALSAASGAAGSAPRRKVGGGGPSGTGRACSNPVFPLPTYDEPSKPSTSNLVPAPAASTRAVSVGSGFPSISAANGGPQAGTPAPNPVVRASSAGSAPSSSNGSFGGPAPRGSIGMGTPNPSGVSAASVVAGVHSVSGNAEPPAPHTTLTPLTPLKRGSSKSESTKLTSLRGGVTRKPNGSRPIGPSPGSPATGALGRSPARSDIASSIGGTVIAAPVAVAPAVMGGSGIPGGGRHGSLSELGGDSLVGLGGEVFNGPLKAAPIGRGKDKWNSSGTGGDHGGLWTSGGLPGSNNLASQPHVGQMGGAAIGGGTIGGGFHNSGSSALASMLGINLPTGSGSLQESSNLWGGSAPGSQPPIAALNGTSAPVQGVIGAGASNTGNGLIGGIPIGGSQIGGTGGNKNDIALLQSLLPGVHITSGRSYSPQDNGFGSTGGRPNEWNGPAPGGNQMQQGSAGGNLRMGDPNQPQHWDGMGGQPIGAIGQGVGKQGQRPAPGSIW